MSTRDLPAAERLRHLKIRRAWIKKRIKKWDRLAAAERRLLEDNERIIAAYEEQVLIEARAARRRKELEDGLS